MSVTGIVELVAGTWLLLSSVGIVVLVALYVAETRASVKPPSAGTRAEASSGSSPEPLRPAVAAFLGASAPHSARFEGISGATDHDAPVSS